MSMLGAAIALAARGFKVFPIADGKKAPPLVKDWPGQATTNQYSIELWYGENPYANIGIHCDGLLVLDIDTHKGGLDSLAGLELEHDLPPTYEQRTPRGGLHLVYSCPTPVKNAVDLLPGIDVRSHGGYIVSAPSVTAAGTYTAIDRPIAPAPQWLVDLVGAARPKDRDAKFQPEAPPGVDAALARDRAVGYLKDAPISTKGAGGDQTAYVVAAKLRDLGVSYAVACELMSGEHWHNGCGWRLEKLFAKPIRSAYTYAQNEAGAEALVFTDLRPKDRAEAALDQIITEPSAPPRRGGPRRLKDFAAPRTGGPGYLVKGFLNRASYAAMTGAPGAGKTFAAVDIAYHVAAGTPWMDKRVKGGAVLYLAYEGAGGLRQRAVALHRKYGDADVPLYFDDTAYNLREKDGRREIGAAIDTLPEMPALIVIDTFAHALCGGDENSAQDVGAFNAGVQGLIQHTGACVLVLHHPAKNKEGLRGSGALLGAIDTEIQVSERTLRATKQRDIEPCAPIVFKLVPTEVGVDEDGDPVTTCVVERVEEAPKPKLHPRTQELYDTVRKAAVESGVEWQGHPAATRAEIATAAYQLDTFKQLAQSGRSKTLRRELADLSQMGLIGWDDSLVWSLHDAVRGADFSPGGP